MRGLKPNSIAGRIRALEPGESLVIEDRKLHAARMAMVRAIRASQKDYTLRTEGKGERRRIVIYCGAPPKNMVTTKAGVQRIRAGVHTKQSAVFQTHCGRKERADRYSMAELAQSVEIGWRKVCAKRGWDPRWA